MTYQESEQQKAKRLGEYLKRLMTQSGLTYTDVAKALDVSVSSVSNWVAGTKQPRPQKIDKMCTLFGITEDQLFGRKVIQEDTAPAILAYAETEAEYVKEKYLKLDSYGKHTVKIVLEAEYNRCAQQRKK